MPAEYDYKIVVARLDGVDGIWMLLAGPNNSQFEFDIGSVMGDQTVGFGLINFQGAENCSDVARNNKGWLPLNVPVTILVKVRKGGLQGYINDKLVCHYKTDYSDMSPYTGFRFPKGSTIGLATTDSSFQIHSAQLIEVTGDK